MQLKTVRHMWGFDYPIATAASKAKAAGYDALELALLGEIDAEAVRGACADNGLELIIQIHTDDFTPGGDVDLHLADFHKRVQRAKALGATFVNSHSGRDAWPEAEAIRFFQEAVHIADEEGIAVCHETHRSRVLYNPFIAKRLIDAVPGLRLTADFSHWTCVCERLFAADEPAIIDVVSRVDYIHGRVGHSQGPQVNDPRAPEHAATVAIFEAWWDAIWSAQRNLGRAVSYFCPEFGPQPYLPSLPYTGASVAPLGQICDWMAEKQRERFSA